MGNLQCIPRSLRNDKRYKELQAKYDASYDAFETALYNWIHKDEVKEFNIDDPKLEEFLDEYFQIKSTNFFSNKSDFERALNYYKFAYNQSNYTDKLVFSSKEIATDRYETRKQYFGENVIMYKNQEGKYVIRIGKPIFKKETEQEKSKSKKESKKKKQEESQDKTAENNKVEKAYDKLQEAIKLISSRVKLNPSTHRITIYDSEKEAKSTKTKSNLKVTSVSRHIYGKSETIIGWGIPSSALGDTNDSVIRDYFEGKLKKEYPNLTKKQLKALINDIKILEKHFKAIYGENCKIITEEFPIAAAYTVIVNGKPEVRYMAGIMDMIVIDSEGKYHIYDMKAKRSGMSNENKIDYGNQMGLYGSMLKAYGIEVEDYHVILSDTGEYAIPIEIDGDNGVTYTAEGESKSKQLYVNGIPIQESEEANYNGIRLHRTESERITTSETLISLQLNEKDDKMTIKFNALDPAEEYESLSKEDKELLEEEVGKPKTKKEKENNKTNSVFQYKESDKGKPTKSGLYDPLLSAEERKFLADQVMHILSHIVSQLQTSKEANNGKQGFFSDGSFASIDFTKMPRQEIINTVGVGNLFNLVLREFRYKAMKIENAVTYNKLSIAIENFDALIDAGYAKLISLEQTATFQLSDKEKVIEDMGNDDVANDNDTATLEEKEREYWQLGQRNISAKASLSKEIRRMLEKLPVLDSKRDHVTDKYGFGFDTYVDSDEAVNAILKWCINCTTISEMEKILSDKAESHPWLNTVLEMIKDEPIRSLFFKNFRKDFTQYSVVIAERDNNGKMTYKVHVINTKSAADTILKNLTAKFSIGGFQNLIITSDEIEGKGRINEKKIEEIADLRYSISEKIEKVEKPTEEHASEITDLLNRFGIEVLTSTVYNVIKNNKGTAKTILNKIDYMCKTMLKQKGRIDYNPMNKEENNGNLWGDYKTLLQILGTEIERSIEASTYEGGKMYYSFVTPSYMGKMIINLKNAINDDEKYANFIEREYKNYRWFWDQNNGGNKQWNNVWLELIHNNPKFKEGLDHKVQLTFNKTPYKDLSEVGYTLSLMQEYFYDKKGNWAWYRMPILSNKPSSEFIRFVRFSKENYKQNIKCGFKRTFNQEILRIKTVLERAAKSLEKDSGIERISNFDINLDLLNKELGKDKAEKLLTRIKNKKFTAEDYISIMKASRIQNGQSGAEFRFLEVFSDEIIKNTTVGELIIKKLNDTIELEEENKLNDLIVGESNGKKRGLLDDYMDKIVEREKEQWKSIGLFETVKRTVTNSNNEIKTTTEYKYLSQLGKSEKEINAKLEEYVWNDTFATINIIQLTATDLAYYKNMEDFQKRFAQVHSPALRLNTEAEYNGVKVSDGMSRTIYIKDLKIKSEIINNLEVIFDKKIEAAKSDKDKKEWRKIKDFVLSNFEKINVTDAQGYSSPTSYRKKMIMAGTWDDTQEEAYSRIIKGDFNLNDLNVIWQPLKPFVYSQIKKTTGVATMSEIKMGVQNKNSEYMILIADALMRGAGMQSTLGAIFDFMENSARDGRNIKKGKEGEYNGKGIDTVQFESAVKVGCMGVIDINDSKTHDEIIKKLEKCVYWSSDKKPSGDNDNDIYNDQYVHTIPYEDYGIQQEVPDHLVDHFQAMGSQVRILSVSDISDEAKFEIHNVKDKKDKNWVLGRYQKLIAENIEDSFKTLSKELKLNTKNRKERNRALSEILVNAIKKDQKYGNDLLRACSLNSEDEFNIPLNDPIQSRRIQELINSIIKSRINKQLVSGGPIVQATSFGLSKNLNIVFKDKETGKSLTIPEKIKGNKAKVKEWLEEHQGALSHMEVYMPVPSKELEKALTKSDGTLMDVDEALEAGIINEEMLKAIAYRIPTEDKYSILPVKIVGWMPKAAGEAIMMPKEITLITGSDFDKHQC